MARQAEKDRQRKKGGKTGRERQAEKERRKKMWKERGKDRQRKAVLVHSTAKHTCTTTYPLENSNNGAGQHKVTKRSLLLEANNANNGPTTVVLPAPMTWVGSVGGLGRVEGLECKSVRVLECWRVRELECWSVRV